MLRDSIESTQAYIEAMKDIKPILNERFSDDTYVMGTCHAYWACKKELLKQRGIDWKSPSEMNPDIIFD